MCARKTVTGVSSYQGIQRDLLVNQSYLSHCVSHLLGRNERVTTLLTFICMMRSQDRINAHDEVSVVAAALQDYKADSERKYQAAHYMPGQVLIGKKKPSVYYDDHTDSAQIQEMLDGLFSAVHNLPAYYNRADTATEAHGRLKKVVTSDDEELDLTGKDGLCVHLRNCCQHMIMKKPSPNERVNPLQVNLVVEQWMTGVVPALQEAVKKKQKTWQYAKTEKTRDRRELEIDTLEAMIRVCQNHTEKIQPNTRKRIEEVEIAVLGKNKALGIPDWIETGFF